MHSSNRQLLVAVASAASLLASLASSANASGLSSSHAPSGSALVSDRAQQFRRTHPVDQLGHFQIQRMLSDDNDAATLLSNITRGHDSGPLPKI